MYWDLINSNMNMNRRDVQTGCSGYVHKNTGDENMYVSSNNLVSVYETGFVLRSLMAWGKKLLLSLSVHTPMCVNIVLQKNVSAQYGTL